MSAFAVWLYRFEVFFGAQRRMCGRLGVVNFEIISELLSRRCRLRRLKAVVQRKVTWHVFLNHAVTSPQSSGKIQLGLITLLIRLISVRLHAHYWTNPHCCCTLQCDNPAGAYATPHRCRIHAKAGPTNMCTFVRFGIEKSPIYHLSSISALVLGGSQLNRINCLTDSRKIQSLSHCTAGQYDGAQSRKL